MKKAYITKGWNALSVTSTAEQCEREKKHPMILSEAGEGCRIFGYMLVNKVRHRTPVCVRHRACTVAMPRDTPTCYYRLLATSMSR